MSWFRRKSPKRPTERPPTPITIATVALLDEDAYIVARHELVGPPRIHEGQTLLVETRFTHEAGVDVDWGVA